MNQILEYSPSKNSGGGSSGSDKIVRVFAIILIIFALCFIAVGGYGFFKKNRDTEKTSTTAPTEAKIVVEKLEDKAVIKISHDKAIEKVIYNWDNDKEITQKTNGTSEESVEIQLPSGEHTLNVKVIDIDGIESTHKETIFSENGTDIINPVIDIQVTEDKKLRITATDETEMAYVTYKWNDEEETRVDVDEDDKKKIEFDIDILKGTNDLTVVAVDANNRTTTKSNPYAGVTKPEVTITVSEDKKSVHVACVHENGIESVKVNINNTGDNNVELPENEANQDIGFDLTLGEGNNTIKIVATSVDGTITEVTEDIETPGEEQELNENIQINIAKAEDNQDEAVISVYYENSIKEVKLNVNDTDYSVGMPEDNPTPQDLTIRIPLVEGNNRITFTAIGTDDTQNVKVEEIAKGE